MAAACRAAPVVRVPKLPQEPMVCAAEDVEAAGPTRRSLWALVGHSILGVCNPPEGPSESDTFVPLSAMYVCPGHT